MNLSKAFCQNKPGIHKCLLNIFCKTFHFTLVFEEVREIATPDVGKMGIEILSFTIKDVYDNVDYLASLGKSQTAAVKRDAEIGVAQVRAESVCREGD